MILCPGSPQYPSRPLFVLLPGASTEPTGSWGSTPRSLGWNVSRAKLWQRSCADQDFIGAVTKEPRKGRIQPEVSAFEFVCAPWHAPQ